MKRQIYVKARDLYRELLKRKIVDKYDLRPAGGWHVLGEGVDRTVFEHPDMPGVVFKLDRAGWYFNGPNANQLELALWNKYPKLRPILARPIVSFKHGIIVAYEKLTFVREWTQEPQLAPELKLAGSKVADRSLEIEDIKIVDLHNENIFNDDDTGLRRVVDYSRFYNKKGYRVYDPKELEAVQ